MHFPLHPETPDEGRSLVELFGGEPARARLEAGHRRLAALAAAEGLEMSARTMTYNSRLAQELGTWAEEQGAGSVFHDAAYRAYFVDGKNLAETRVLVGLAVSVGLDSTSARRVIETRSHSQQVDADWARSRQMGVTGVPTFIAGGSRVVGAQPYEVLEQLVVSAGARPRRPSE